MPCRKLLWQGANMSRLVICIDCDKEQAHYAKGLCHPCYIRQYLRAWRKKNPDKARAIDRRKYRKYRKKILARVARWQRENMDKVVINTRQWRRKNPERMAVYNSRRRAVKRGLPDTLGVDEGQRKLSTFPCFYCGAAIDLTLDHFVPMSKNGGTTKANIVIACNGCNSKKHTKLPQEFLNQLELWGVDARG